MNEPSALGVDAVFPKVSRTAEARTAQQSPLYVLRLDASQLHLRGPNKTAHVGRGLRDRCGFVRASNHPRQLITSKLTPACGQPLPTELEFSLSRNGPQPRDRKSWHVGPSPCATRPTSAFDTQTLNQGAPGQLHRVVRTLGAGPKMQIAADNNLTPSRTRRQSQDAGASGWALKEPIAAARGLSKNSSPKG